PHHAAPLAQAASIGAPLPIAPDTAGIANAFAAATPAPAPTPPPPHRSSAQDGPMFYGLFADAGSNGPVGPLVSQLWGAPNGAHAVGAPSTAAPSGVLMDLFKDSSAKS